ncbi:MAG: hypothetical protein KGZ75_06840 [Syntrophomonadaceae bacterium]|nr:hypothetical protein [Syntrophomonadaceae bacterium]
MILRNFHFERGNIGDEKIDKKTEAALIRAMENAKAYNQQLQENKEKRLWKKVYLPCSLNDTLNGLTKAKMDIIRCWPITLIWTRSHFSVKIKWTKKKTLLVVKTGRVLFI